MNAVNNSGTICFTFYQEITFVYVMNGVYLEDGTRISSQANEIPGLSWLTNDHIHITLLRTYIFFLDSKNWKLFCFVQLNILYDDLFTFLMQTLM